MDTKEDINKLQGRINTLWSSIDINKLRGHEVDLEIFGLVRDLFILIQKQDTIIKELQKQVDDDIRTMIDSMSDPSPEGDMDMEEIIKKYGA